MSDDTIEVESCWTGEAGARKCLNQALHLVGLNDGPLGDLGVEIMVGEKQKIAKEHKVIAPDCVGLPLMQKISKQHKVIASDCVGWLLKQKISKQHKVATQELHENCTRCAPALHAHAHNGAPPSSHSWRPRAARRTTRRSSSVWPMRTSRSWAMASRDHDEETN